MTGFGGAYTTTEKLPPTFYCGKCEWTTTSSCWPNDKCVRCENKEREE